MPNDRTWAGEGFDFDSHTLILTLPWIIFWFEFIQEKEKKKKSKKTKNVKSIIMKKNAIKLNNWKYNNNNWNNSDEEEAHT